MTTELQKEPSASVGSREFIRPLRIFVQWVDPFDNQSLCSWDSPYDPRRSANGYYTQEIKRLTEDFKNIFGDIVQDRTPKTITRLSWSNNKAENSI